MTVAIRVEDLCKSFNGIQAVRNISFEVEKGRVFGLLGPNGAGKTTVIRVLTTLTQPTRGRAEVSGFDVCREPIEVRRLIGVVPQDDNADRYLTARENLELHAIMHGMSDYDDRIDELLELMQLSHRANDFPDKFSSGMRRRLIIARALVHQPRVLFLDEPTTGLDPQSRHAIWNYIEELREEVTILLTTHYMEEADRLTDEVLIMDNGKELVRGPSEDLKREISGGPSLSIAVREPENYLEQLRGLDGVNSVSVDVDTLHLGIESPVVAVAVLGVLGDEVLHMNLREPTLEDVFIQLTGRGLRD